MAVWRQEPAGAVLVGRLLPEGEVRFDVVVCFHREGEWEITGGGGSSTGTVSTPFDKDEKIRWFFFQDVLFYDEDDEDGYVTTMVGVAAPGTEQLTLRFSDDASVKIDVESDDRLVFVGLVRPDAEEELSFQVN